MLRSGDVRSDRPAELTGSVDRGYSVLIVPDKDADGIGAGTLLYRTLQHLGVKEERIKVQHLKKGNNVHCDEERARMEAAGTDKIIVLDQGSRPGAQLAPTRAGQGNRVLIIDHHMSTEWPEEAQVLTACHSPPIATAALLTYMMLRPLHKHVVEEDSWRAIVGVFGDLGPSEAKWGTPPWPAELGPVVKKFGSKNFADAVAGINAPRRTAEYDVPKGWEIMLNARSPAQVAGNAYLKLCKLDVREETEKWARTAPKFSLDGRVAVVSIHTGFQVHPVIATRWAGNLGKKSKKLVMVMCANTGFNPNPDMVSFSCRIASSLRQLPEGERPNLIALLEEYGDAIPGFRERVGGDFARGHKEATGGIIPHAEFELLLREMGVGVVKAHTPSPQKSKQATTRPLDPGQRNSIRDFFPSVASTKPEQ